jgi:hypothetical protein
MVPVNTPTQYIVPPHAIHPGPSTKLLAFQAFSSKHWVYQDCSARLFHKNLLLLGFSCRFCSAQQVFLAEFEGLVGMSTSE